jgi:cephalosporin hydroxylase
MVTLDSGHNMEHVLEEMEKYCPLVTVGAYCIVEVCSFGNFKIEALNVEG